MGIWQNLKQNSIRNAEYARAKYRLLQRFTIVQLEEVFNDFIKANNADKPPINPDSLFGVIDMLQSAPGSNSRQRLIDTISKQMSLETIKDCAAKYGIKHEDIVVA